MSERKTWEIRSIHHPVITVIAPTWLAALGAALSELGMEDGLERLACERLASGLIIANDVGRKKRFTVRDVTGRAVQPPRPRPAPPRRPPSQPKTPQGPYLDWMLEGLRSIH